MISIGSARPLADLGAATKYADRTEGADAPLPQGAQPQAYRLYVEVAERRESGCSGDRMHWLFCDGPLSRSVPFSFVPRHSQCYITTVTTTTVSTDA